MQKFELIYSILSESATPEDEKEFSIWVAKEENSTLFEQMKQVWTESPNVKNYRKHEAVSSFYQMGKRITNKRMFKKKLLLAAATGIAAGVIIMLGIFNLAIPQMRFFDNQEIVHFQTELGNRSQIYLPDGSKVWLNAKSDLRYSSSFNSTMREVFLQGEGFFEVAKSEKPFIVNIEDLKIKVYGTKFNVSAYSNDQLIQTCLESGKISIQNSESKEYFVKPGELALYDKKTVSMKIENVDPLIYSGWRMNKIYLNNEPIQVLAKKLERQYNVTIGFTPIDLGNKIHYSGVFGNESLEEILEAISVASGLSYTKKENHYQIVQ